MPTSNAIVGRKTGAVLLILTTTSLFAQGSVTLLGPSIHNGSFEDGVLTPWTVGAGSMSLLQDHNFATDGEWFAAVSETAQGSIVRPGIGQWLGADRRNGLTFSLTFDVRNGTAPFEGVRVFFAARNSDASYFFATNTFFTPISSEWQDFGANFQLPEVWDGGGTIFLGLQFENFSATQGATYTGYLDNIVLQQIPEPSALALLSLGGSLLAARRSAPGRFGRRGGAGFGGCVRSNAQFPKTGKQC